MTASDVYAAIRFAKALVFFGVPMVAIGAEPSTTTYFLVPALGSLIAVQAAASTGSVANHNRIELLGPPGAAFDGALMDAMEAMLTKIRPGSDGHIVRARVSEGTLFLERTPEDDTESIRALKSALASQLADAPSALALIVAPFRAAPHMAIDTGTRGEGKVTGLGFYIDRMTPLRTADSAASDTGFLGIFANIRVLLVDLGTSRIFRDDTATVGTTFARARSPDGNPWNAISSEQKISVLQRMVLVEINRLIPLFFDQQK
jgi:hypothetical protein